MASTASFQISGILSGLPSGQQRIAFPLVNSTSAGGIVTITTATTAGSSVASPIVLNANTQFVLIEPPTTNTVPLRISGSTADLVGVQLSSVNPSLLSVVGSSTVYFFSTGATTFLVRVTQY